MASKKIFVGVSLTIRRMINQRFDNLNSNRPAVFTIPFNQNKTETKLGETYICTKEKGRTTARGAYHLGDQMVFFCRTRNLTDSVVAASSSTVLREKFPCRPSIGQIPIKKKYFFS
jgi:hypothetical protein